MEFSRRMRIISVSLCTYNMGRMRHIASIYNTHAINCTLELTVVDRSSWATSPNDERSPWRLFVARIIFCGGNPANEVCTMVDDGGRKKAHETRRWKDGWGKWAVSGIGFDSAARMVLNFICRQPRGRDGNIPLCSAGKITFT